MPSIETKTPCPSCGYQNAPGVDLCNLCRKLLRKAVVHIIQRPIGEAIRLEPGQRFTLGRLAQCSFAIASGSVSRVHAEIQWEGGQPVLVDQSTYGTFVNGSPVRRHALVAGDQIRIGPFEGTYGTGERDAARNHRRVSEEATVAGEGAVFCGTITGTSLAEYLQSLEFNAKTGTLHVFGIGKGRAAWLSLEGGVPMSAQFDALRDREAALAILALTDGRFVFSAGVVAGTGPRLGSTITALLLEAHRRRDEASRRPTRA